MLKDIFKINAIKAENKKLKDDISNLEAVLTPDVKEFIELKNKLDEVKIEIEKGKSILDAKTEELNLLNRQVEDKKNL